MDLLLTRSLWGLEDDPDRFADALAPVAAAGYDGVSCPVQLIPDPARFADALEATGLEYVPQIFTFGRSIDDHVEMFADALVAAARFQPTRVLAQAGRDSWDPAQASSFLGRVAAIEFDQDAVVAHETHRGRLLCNPWVATRLLERHPVIRVSADLSHWVCVAERLDIGSRAIALVAERAAHIDARIGFEQGPQVSDPDAGRYGDQRRRFEHWWDEIWAAQLAQAAPALSITPEYGPPPYQPVDPSTGQPARALARIVDGQAALLRSRYDRRCAPGSALLT